MRFNVGDVVIAKNDFSIKKEDGTDFFIKAGDAGIIEKTTTIRGIALYKVNLNDHILCTNEQCLEATFRPIKLLAGTRFSVRQISLLPSISKTQSIPAGEYEILDEKTLLDGNKNNKKVYWCRDIKGNIVMIMSDLLHYYITSGTASIVKAYTPKEEEPTKRSWTPWRTYTKQFITEYGQQNFTFSIRSNGKRTVCRTYVTNDDDQTIKIEGVSTCNEKAGEVFSAKYGLALATIRCETALANWLSNNLQKKLTTIKDAKISLTKQATEYAFIKASLLNGNFNMQDFDEFVKRGAKM